MVSGNRPTRRTLLFLPLVLVLTGCHSFFYWPEKTYPAPGYLPGSQLHERYFPGKSGKRLSGWLLPARTSESKGLVVYCHGTDTNIGEYLEAVEFLPDQGFDLFLFDYGGYGASEGKPFRRGTIDDAHAAIDYAKADPLVRGKNVALYGYSLGAGVAHVTASERDDVVGVVAESGFTTYREIGKKVARENWFTWTFSLLSRVLVLKGLDPIEYIDQVTPRPLYLIHGENDEVVPVRMAKQLYEKAYEPKRLWIIKNATHYSPPEVRHPHYERRISGYFSYIFAEAEGREVDFAEDVLPGGVTYD